MARSGGSNVEAERRGEVERLDRRSAARCGWVSAHEIGTRMSGQPGVREQGAVAEPHHPVHDRLRVHDHLDRRRTGSPNSWCASITSRPLFISVAESIVIFCAHAPGRVGERVGRGRRRRARRARRPRNGPPEAVMTSPVDRTRSRRPRGTGRAPSARCRPAGAGARSRAAAASTSSPAGHEALLVRERDVGARGEGRERGPEAGGADDRVQHEVGPARCDQLLDAARPAEHDDAVELARGRSAASGSTSATCRAPVARAAATSPSTSRCAERAHDLAGRGSAR